MTASPQGKPFSSIIFSLSVSHKIAKSLARAGGKRYNKNMDKQKSERILTTLKALYPDAKPALQYSTAYELLVAVILSAQCTDERVNKVTKELFRLHNTPETMLSLSQEELEGYIFSCGLYRSKARHILSASADIVSRFHGEVPGEIKQLKTLSGVGQKTANVVYAVWFGGDAIAVDTHVFRVSNRLGLAKAADVKKTEEQLQAHIPQEEWSKAHHLLIFHGRRVCHARNPACSLCALAPDCEYEKKNLQEE